MTRLHLPILLAAAAVAACGQGRKDATSADSRPTTLRQAIKQARQGAQAARPAANGQVAIIDLVASTAPAATTGTATAAAQAARPQVSARLASARVVAGQAPNLFAGGAGDWEVRLKGRTPISYRIADPTDVEIENPPGSKSPFSRVVQTGPVPVRIVVPLTRDGRSLGVESVEIVDAANGRTIVTVPLAAAAAPH